MILSALELLGSEVGMVAIFLVLTNKDTTGCIRVSEKTPSRQFVNRSSFEG
jgi:hypothetical protein